MVGGVVGKWVVRVIVVIIIAVRGIPLVLVVLVTVVTIIVIISIVTVIAIIIIAIVVVPSAVVPSAIIAVVITPACGSYVTVSSTVCTGSYVGVTVSDHMASDSALSAVTIYPLRSLISLGLLFVWAVQHWYGLTHVLDPLFLLVVYGLYWCLSGRCCQGVDR